jgi:hypothetical protein
LQADRRRPMLYTQAAGLMHFVMQHDRGRYRDAVVAALDAIYSGQDSSNTFVRLAETTNDELDRQYKEYIKHLPPPERPADKSSPPSKPPAEPSAKPSDAKEPAAK